MFTQLHKTLVAKISVTDAEFTIVKAFFKPKKLRKRQYLLQEGDVCNRLAFVEKGSLYSYSVDNKGIQHVIQFAFDGWWIADLYSYLTGEKSLYNIEALEDCELLVLDQDDEKELVRQFPRYEVYTKTLYQNAYVALQRRLQATLGLTAEEKYSRLMDSYASLAEKVPQHLIASYLGITPETLSRIRKQLSR
jgi:CRP-like cAMP-binding protein